ncbi:hypothetical protein MBAV_005171 [Candidatus Magnetobacterium bavaricum]|uniref:Uncharacterized protein n=1 Tax=Candidatus Magnetobacterium bavaricum TaxID=29290 RepID=A0A0F3GPL7_9BACT|nr:hypothetical protein MBAV_005171 [Candidatus Magnetobacterium bavaricum]
MEVVEIVGIKNTDEKYICIYTNHLYSYTGCGSTIIKRGCQDLIHFYTFIV